MRRRAAGWVLLCAIGCGDPGPRPAAPPVTLTAGATTLRVDPAARQVTLERDGAVLLRFPADGLQLGTVDAVSDLTNYDPWSLVPGSGGLGVPPTAVRWLDVERLTVSAATDDVLDLVLRYPGALGATLHVEVARPDSLRARLSPTDGAAAVAYFRLRPRADPEEGFYGLGEVFDAVNHRGRVRAMQLELDGSTESGNNEAHVPIPLLIGTRGWGLFVEDSHPGVFQIATDAPDLVDAIFGTGSASAAGLLFHLYTAAHPLDVTKRYYDDTGPPALPARWALGPWLWRNENRDQAQVEADANAMRDLDLPHDGLWIDRPYATAVNSFDFDPARFPSPPSMIDLLRSLGLRVALWHTPYLDAQAAATAALYQQASAGGFFPARVGLLLNDWSAPIDFTNPAALAFWQGLLHRYTDLGVEGWKLDYGEDVVVGVGESRLPWLFSDGSDERTMHERYQIGYHGAYARTLPPEGGFLLCRHAAVGDQVHGPILWPGDLDASFARRGEPQTAGQSSYVSVGGLPASLIAGLSLGPSGFPFYGADTGGYRHAPPDKELEARWFEQTALSTVMQVGNGASTVPWEPDVATGYDAELLAWYRIYTRLHLQLFPYEWTYAERLPQDGRAITRPLGLAYPELGVHPDDEYLFGDVLLVAPVVARGQTARDVLLPPGGRWIDWWTGQPYQGGQTVTVPAPLGTLPLFLAEAGIVPLLRPSIDSLSPTSDPVRVDSYATTPGVLYVRVAPGAPSDFVVFDGTRLHQEQAGTLLTLSAADGSEFRSGALFEVSPVPAAPTGATLDGTPLAAQPDLAALEGAVSGWTWTPPRLYLKLPAGQHTATATLP